MRFFAALWVVGYHFLPILLPGARETIPFVERGRLGVELFFILSGFILSHVYFQAFESKAFDYKKFVWARFARVYPLHLLTMAVFAAVSVMALIVGINISGDLTRLDTVWQNLTLTHAWGVSPAAAWNTPSWSISAEWFAYLAFPLFATIGMQFRQRPRTFVLLAAASIPALYLVWGGLMGSVMADQTILFGVLRIIPTFAYGMALYLWFRDGAFQSRRASAWLTVCATVAMLALAALDAFDGWIVISAGLIILGLAGLARSGDKTLGHPVLVWLGEVSFAIYMFLYVWEVLLLKVYEKLGLYVPGEALHPALWLMLPVGLMMIASAAHHLVEHPARNALRKLYGGLRPKPERTVTSSRKV